MSGPVILVHGLFYGGWSMAVLARRLRRAGFDARTFGYHPTRNGLGAADDLLRFARKVTTGPVHFVGHSFGGLVILKALRQAAEAGTSAEMVAGTGRTVLLGSPLRGSRVARRLIRWSAGRAMLRAAGPPLADGYDQIGAGSAVGLIAGDSRWGLGRITGALGPSDGTVALDEVAADGVTGRRVLPVSHTGMLFSRAVAAEVAGFLQNGHFSGADSVPG